jgi:hypothetical protein
MSLIGEVLINKVIIKDRLKELWKFETLNYYKIL